MICSHFQCHKCSYIIYIACTVTWKTETVYKELQFDLKLSCSHLTELSKICRLQFDCRMLRTAAAEHQWFSSRTFTCWITAFWLFLQPNQSSSRDWRINFFTTLLLRSSCHWRPLNYHSRIVKSLLHVHSTMIDWLRKAQTVKYDI